MRPRAHNGRTGFVLHAPAAGNAPKPANHRGAIESLSRMTSRGAPPRSQRLPRIGPTGQGHGHANISCTRLCGHKESGNAPASARQFASGFHPSETPCTRSITRVLWARATSPDGRSHPAGSIGALLQPAKHELIGWKLLVQAIDPGVQIGMLNLQFDQAAFGRM
jgi:hypothetical protein